MPIPIPVELDRCAPASAGGFLSGSCPLPQGWERGISFNDTSCLTPTVMGECPPCDIPGLKDAQRAGTETFRPVALIQAVECSTFGGIDVQAVARDGLDATAGYALARELLTGEAARRDANPRAQGDLSNPSLQTHAIDLGTGFDDIIAAVGCLEQALADTTAGRRGVILVGPQLALEMWPFLVREGGNLFTITGTRVIVDGGFDGRPPVGSPADDSPGDPCVPWNTTGGPVAGDELWIYGTSAIWAGVGATGMLGDVNRANNTATARDERVALAAFTPCATFAVGSSIAAACTSRSNVADESPGPEPIPSP
jgi:hypothetical protein